MRRRKFTSAQKYAYKMGCRNTAKKILRKRRRYCKYN